MPVVVEEYLEQFDQNVAQMQDQIYADTPSEHERFMKVENISRAFVNRNYIGGLGSPVPNRDAMRIPLKTPPKGFQSTFVPVTYRLGYIIERQMVEDEMWGLLASRPASMIKGAKITMDINGANLLNNGATLQSYDIGGTPLFSTAQVREDGMGTWSNNLATALPITVETVIQAIVDLLYNLTDMNGFPIPYVGAINLYVPSISPTLWKQAIEVVNSIMNPNTTDNKMNAATKMFSLNVVPLRFLTNANVWFLGWEPSSEHYGLVMMVRQTPDITSLAPYGSNPDVWYSRLRMRFVSGYDNKRGIARVGA